MVQFSTLNQALDHILLLLEIFLSLHFLVSVHQLGQAIIFLQKVHHFLSLLSQILHKVSKFLLVPGVLILVLLHVRVEALRFVAHHYFSGILEVLEILAKVVVNQFLPFLLQFFFSSADGNFEVNEQLSDLISHGHALTHLVILDLIL